MKWESGKSWAREALVRVAEALTAGLWIPARLEARLGKGEGWFTMASELLSMAPGLGGVFLRRGFYRMTLEAFASDCHIGFGTTLAHRQVRIARGVYIGSRCTLGSVIIEEHATIGSNVDILSGRRQHAFAAHEIPVQEQGGTFQQIRLGRNIWIGNSSVIMADVGDDCVIGAGSVVVKPIARGAVAVGNPATVKKASRPPARRIEIGV